MTVAEVPRMLRPMLIAPLVLLAVPLAAPAQPAACAACVAVSITPAQAATLPDALGGISVLVTLDAGGTGDGAARATEAIRARGGLPGVLLDWRVPPAAVPPVPLAILRMPGVRASEKDLELAFAVKTRITALRASMPPGSRVGLAPSAGLLDRLAGEIAPYIDFVVLGDADRAALDKPVWRERGSAAVDEAIRNVPADVERVLIAAPRDEPLARALFVELARMAVAVDVTAARPLTVEEIVARHQAATARQRDLIRTQISTGRLTLTFEAPGLPAPVTIASDTVIYAGDGRTEIEQRRILVNGLEYRNRGVPRLPILEPERVTALPLVISLTGGYAYRLAGRETIRGTPCFVVSFAPRDDRPAFRGRAWIAEDGFGLVRVAAVQTGLSGPIVSSEQVDDFRLEPIDQDDRVERAWLLARTEVRQLYEGAAHRTPLHRILEIDAHVVNDAGFDARRRSAYTSGSVMMRDTPAGYRYLERPDRRDADTAASAAAPEVTRGTRRIRTLAGGVILDPNITHPLPFAGVGYVDFDLLGTGAQVNAFLGGTYGQLAWSAPSIAGSRWHLAGRAFAIASSFHDRAFAGGLEQYPENIRQRPAHASVSLLRPLTARFTVRFGYEIDYTRFEAAESTAADFRLPASQVAHGARLALEGQRGGWTAAAWWNPVRRSGWRAWGTADVPEDTVGEQRNFQRVGVSLARSRVLTRTLLIRNELSWSTGRDLDRFSRYSFGTFDNRLRGYPSALIRYDRGGVLRTAVAWTAAPVVRVDGFVDAAWVHEPSMGAGLRHYTGIGAALEAPAPFGCLAALEWGYGVQGIRSDGGRGTHVLRISAVKVF